MKITIFSCSQQQNSQSRKIAEFISSVYTHRPHNTTYIDLFEMGLPFYNPDLTLTTEQDKNLAFIKEHCASSDGFIFVIPEWNGTFTPIFSNLMLYLPNSEMVHKPALLVTVSASLGGSMIIPQIRGVAYKNTHITYIPEHVIVREVNSYFNELYNANTPYDERPYIEKRLLFALTLLDKYTDALSAMRQNASPHELLFHISQNGMS